ncbi:MAG: hypothetical protein ACOC6H_02860 [Thermoproteota archaeon]
MYSKVKRVGERLRIFGLVALLGFMAGVIAQLTADYVIPMLIEMVPELMELKFLISGFVGALLTLLLVSIWAYITGPPNP